MAGPETEESLQEPRSNDDEWGERVGDTIASIEDDDVADWILEAVREKYVIDNLLYKTDTDFKNEYYRFYTIRRAIAMYVDASGFYDLECSSCRDTWLFSSEEKAEAFAEDHASEMGHFVEYSPLGEE